MWSSVIFVSFFGLWVEAQNNRGGTPQDHSGHGWDIRLAVPGEPGNDYPTLGSIPRTSFSCAGKEPGYYADVEAGCQVFRICTVGSTYGFQSFLCPNGTLFNQEVFVCDWWMNVKCQDTQRLIKIQTEKFSNLRLGPQLMKDIKKMLTHPMRNPYDKSAMKSNLIVMQDYKPPAGQLFPNSALIAGPEKPPNNVYVPTKQNQQIYSPNDIAFSASTPDTRYVPAGFTNRPLNTDAEIFQRQRQSAQYVQNNNFQTSQPPNLNSFVSNGYTPQLAQNRDKNYNNVPQSRQNQFSQPNNIQYTQNYKNNAVTTQTSNSQNISRKQVNRQRAQYNNIKKPMQFSEKQNEIVSFTKQQYNYEKQPYTYSPPIPSLPEELNSYSKNDVKQNLVSTDLPSTVITKTLTFSKIIQEPKPGRPKSRVTVKTWIAKPKSSRLLAEPTSYVYDRPTQPPKERLIVDETSSYVYNQPQTSSQLQRVVKEEDSKPYVYNRPTAPPQAQRIVQNEPKPYVYNRPTTPPQAQKILQDEPQPYVYNRPTTSPQAQRIVQDEPQPYVYNRPPPLPSRQTEKLEDNDEPQPYVYNRPTEASKLIITTSELSRAYLPPSPTSARARVTQAARIKENPSSSPPTKASRVYLAPTTFNPAARLYLPPNPQIMPQQYATSNTFQQPTYYQSSQLKAAPTSPATTYVPPQNSNNPSYTVVKQPDTRSNNLTFTDILTKEKLDITVNDIVKDTGKFLQTAAPPQFGQYRQDISYPDDNYLPAEQDDSGENLTSQPPTATTSSKSARLITQPARNLEPPAETSNNSQNTNHLANLPFFKEPAFPNTIERTVSLKITIPERVASYLFKSGNETDFDRLEILNTGSSNYLVLSNNLLNQNSENNIPINKVLENKNSNISNSQALVFSFLADSLNAAKKYSNIVKQDILSSTSTPAQQYPNMNSEDITQITNKISQLTSSQFSNNNNFNAEFTPATQTTTKQNTTPIDKENQQNKVQQTAQYNIQPSLQDHKLFNSQYQNDILNINSLGPNQNQIYSGQLYQLPVPEVTSQIYNQPQSANLVQTNLQQNTQTTSPQTTNQNNNVPYHNSAKQSSAEVIDQSQTLPLNPAKLQLELANEPESFYSQESLDSLLNSDNGISAQLQDKIVGTIPHPLEDNKLLTYEKDQSYYLYTKFDKNGQTTPLNAVSKVNNIPSVITFQFVPSVSYQLEDEKEQQKLLNTFQIDEFGVPRNVVRTNLGQSSNQQRGTLISTVDYSVEHPKSAKQVNFNSINALYKGPSSYSAPQGSIGSLSRQTLPPNVSSMLEQFNENTEGYPKTSPVRRFVF